MAWKRYPTEQIIGILARLRWSARPEGQCKVSMLRLNPLSDFGLDLASVSLHNPVETPDDFSDAPNQRSSR